MITIIRADGVAEQKQLDAMRARAAEKNTEIELAVQAIMENVKAEGFAAVARYSREFDHKEPYEISQKTLDEAYDSCTPELIRALEHAAANIRDYNEKLLTKSMEWTSPDGGKVGRIVRGLTRVGIYVPGGTAAYPSSVLMNAVPAKVAGVEEIVMVTPPTENLSAPVLAAAKIAGVDRVIAVGGAQAVAALTYGAGFIPRVDKLVGPGNAFVAAAKRLAYGTLDIDMVAGPSEVLVIADDTADPKYVAADLLSQAEHDRLASAVLLTDSMELARAVDAEIVRQTGYLSRSEIMEASLRDFGCAIVCDSLERCVEIANDIAPEHLEIVTKAPRELLAQVKNAGAVFLGAYTPEPLGDYLAGPDHVLPTSGTARFFSPLSVDSFLKSMSVLEFDRASLEPISGEIIALAETERLTAHANSVRVRFESTVYFVRHAEPNYDNHDDLSRELSPKGRRDRALVTRFLMDKNVDAVVSSPYRRAVDTVSEFAQIKDLTISIIDDFRERRIDSGWIEDFDAFSKTQWADFSYKLSDGESLGEVQERNISALKSLIKEYEGKTVVVGSHGTALSTIINYYDKSFGYFEFKKIQGLMPWVVQFVFEGEKCIKIQPYDLFEELSLVEMSRELCHKFYQGFDRDPDTYMDMSLFQPFEYDPEWVDRYFDRQQDPSRIMFAVMCGGRPIGQVDLKHIDSVKKECELSIHMRNDSVKGKGYGTQAERLAVDYAFNVLGMEAVNANAVQKNTRSQHVLEKAGFRYVSEDETYKYYRCERET